MLGTEKNDESSQQVLRLDVSYYEMSYDDKFKYIKLLLGTISPNPAVRERDTEILNRLTKEAEDQIKGSAPS